MPGSDPDTVRAEYATSDSLRVRLDTHRLYSEQPDDLDDRCRRLMCLSGEESVLDVGPGPGRFEAHLRSVGHRGLLVGVDASVGIAVEAAGIAPSARWVVGDAQALPARSGAFDWAVARHMLYHVPDIPAALSELRRAIREGGAALVTTNGADSLPALRNLRRDAAEAFGLPAPGGQAGGAFPSTNALELLHSAFPRVETVLCENALRFTDAAPVANYVESTFTLGGIAEDTDLRDRLREWLLRKAQRAISSGGGVLHDPKYGALYLAHAE
ncbi:methyltransferase domain-containing protein [Candidatus Poribacteria bacterium]|nr:methyltransferase domain-containing protein [Candidatus Poribacteria bacterium]MBT5536268.1 methyltransferase domain-containing protein [Candidatus Poribacteria bacterium]MBT5714495.1 methyltransferase domain-containing protein [Candidatus Poribacteria bacterium]MBT7096510.1 methyltransferase domain-containing protein [Candidatus Poribacteria bacterium]MBT7806598.1 methyltransferase domain-containing protein [Candidatus Poribacteria bacterium]